MCMVSYFPTWVPRSFNEAKTVSPTTGVGKPDIHIQRVKSQHTLHYEKKLTPNESKTKSKSENS